MTNDQQDSHSSIASDNRSLSGSALKSAAKFAVKFALKFTVTSAAVTALLASPNPLPELAPEFAINVNQIWPGASTASAQQGQDQEFSVEEEKARKKRLDEMENLLKVAGQAGFTEEEIKNITQESEDGGVIKVWEFVQSEKARLVRKKEAKEEQSKKKYLTVHDVTEELIRSEPPQLKRLRDELIFLGDSEE